MKRKGLALSNVEGFTIIEFIIAAGIFVIIATSAVVTVLQSGMLDSRGNTQEKARRFAQEGQEAARSIRNQSWTSLVSGTYGISSSGGTWAFSGTADYNAGMIRRIVIGDVYRNGSGTIVTSGGTLDPDTKKATVTVTWTSEAGRQQTITQESYLTNYKKSIGGCGEWDSIAQESSINLSGVDNGVKITTQGNYAYMTRESGSPDFAIIDITDTANPILRGTLDLSGGQNNIAVAGNYAYIASYSDSRELQIINIANPNAPSFVGSFNAPGNADGLGIHLDVSTVYLTKASSAYHEVFIINVSNPASPTSIGSFNLFGSNGEEILVMGNYAYLPTSDDSREFWVLNISNPANPTTADTYDIPGTIDGQSVTGYNNRVFIGMNDGDVYTFDVTNPTNVQLLGTYDAGDDVEYMVLSSDNTCLYMATDYVGGEFQAVNIANPSSPLLGGSFNISDNINGVAYHTGKNRIFLNTKMDNSEFVGLKPQ